MAPRGAIFLFVEGEVPETRKTPTMSTRTIDTAVMIPALTEQLRALRALDAVEMCDADRAMVDALIESAKGALISLHILRARDAGLSIDRALDAVCGAGSYDHVVAAVRARAA